MNRRQFLTAGAAAAYCAGPGAFAAPGQRAVIVIDPADKITSGPVAGWAVGQLRQALSDKGVSASLVLSVRDASQADMVVILTTPAMGEGFPAEGFRVAATTDKIPTVMVSASDARGFVYGLLELTERVRFGGHPLTSLALIGVIEERPANTIRSVTRLFVSEIEDKAWYNDKVFWRDYLDVLVASRFNRFSLTFGLGYDFPKGVTGDYFHFPYPYLLDVPGYDVRAVPLADGERERNLEMLQFIARETAARGMHFQLGIWTHAYQWVDSPHADHHIEGLSADTHAAYCRDALALLLRTCPEIGGVSLRVHGESGIPEGSYSFWQTLFEAVSGCGRQVEIDMHAKGIDQKMIDLALATGMPVKVAPKFSAEHMGLGYQQADIRQLEWPQSDAADTGTFALSSGSRRFLRYGYGDLFHAGRRFDVLFRLWPGTQHVLLWGDPATAAAYGRTASFCGASGLEICDPLTFKGRGGSGQPGGRCAYLDPSLRPTGNDWRKFEYSYLVWGRSLYNPDTGPLVFSRFLKRDFTAAADAVYDALANAGRILPLVTMTHLPSASNMSYWPEIYTNMPIIAAATTPPYPDTPAPRSFGTVSPLDPQLFLSPADYARLVLKGEANGKYSPMEVAAWLDGFANRAMQALAIARGQAPSAHPEFRRVEEDVLIYIGLGRFFAGKMRAAVLFAIYQQTGDRKAGELAVAALAGARDSWAGMAKRAAGVYAADITYGAPAHLRGNWLSRLPAIDSDLAAVRDLVQTAPAQGQHGETGATAALRRLARGAGRLSARCGHLPAATFSPGNALPLSLAVAQPPAEGIASVTLWYRHVNHAERWSSMLMERRPDGFAGAIEAGYTDTAFPLQYYFELRAPDGAACLYPGFNATLSNQPYYVVASSDA